MTTAPDARPAEGCWPTPEQALLLRAALLDGDDAPAAWKEWRARADLASLDISSRRLFPLLYRNLARHNVRDPLMERLKESFSRTYFENHLLFERAATVLRAFEDAGIRTMVLKGGALVEAYYGDAGLRPMQDFDILVPTPEARAAMRILRGLGWHGTYDREPERRIDVVHSIPFRDRNSRQLDLHWHVLADCWHADDDRPFWERSLPMEIGGVPTRRLDAGDQLLHLCVHGIRWDEPPPIRWIADATTVLKTSGASIVWDRFIEEVEYRHMVLAAADGLAYLKDNFGAAVPDAVITRLRDGAARVGRLDRFIYGIETGPYRRLSTVEFCGVLCVDFVRTSSSRRGPRLLTTFARRTLNRWHGMPAWKLALRLPLTLVRRLGRRVVTAARVASLRR